MAKGKSNFSGSENTINTMPERNEFERVGEKDVAFHNFEKTPIIYCTNIRKEKLTYDVFLVTDQTTETDVYLPAHEKIKELFDSGTANDEYKIEFLGMREFGEPNKHGERKTYHSYDTFRAKKKK